jgi:hypothetical protein
MKTENELKEIVRDTYAKIATHDKVSLASSCCGSGCCSAETISIMAEDYRQGIMQRRTSD